MPMFTTSTTKESVVDLALEAGALFPVLTSPVSIGEFVPTIKSGVYAGEPENVVHYRMLNGEPVVLNVAHPSHPSSNYLQVVETAEALFPGTGVHLETIEEGRKLLFVQELGEPVDLGGGDTIAPNLLWTASLDSSWSTGAHGLGFRYFCTNQLPLSECHLKVRRTLNHDFHLGTKSAIMARLMERFDSYISNVSTLRSIKVSEKGFSSLLGKLIPAPAPDAHGKTLGTYERKVAAIRYYWAEESDGPAAGSAWAAFNAIQSAEAHDFTKGKNQARKQTEMVSEERHSALSDAAMQRLVLELV